MYFINEEAGKAAKKRGHAIYPDDFPMLKAPPSDFFAWKEGDDIHVETTPQSEEQIAALKKEGMTNYIDVRSALFHGIL